MRSMQDSSPTVVLKAGTRVKHGTVAANLASILKVGIRPGFNRHSLRSITEERPKADAVYVGGLSACFGAWASASALIKEYELKEPSFSSIVSTGDQSILKSERYSDPPLAIPVVLEITLAEDTELVGDEDYALWQIGSDGSVEPTQESTNFAVWSKFASGGLLLKEGVPASWIKRVEFPQLLRIDNTNESQFKRLMPDCHMFAASVHQNHALKPARDVSIGGVVWTEDMTLSQTASFEQREVNKLLGFPALSAKSNRLHNILTQYSFVSHIGTEDYGIRFK